MQRSTRRRLLLSIGTIGTVSLAGCLANSEDSPEDEDGAEETGESDTAGSDSGDTDSQSLEYDVMQLEGGATGPLWRKDRAGFVTLLETEQDEPWMIDESGAESNGESAVEDWYTETDFEKSSILYVESAGPNTCTDTLDIEDVTVDDGVLTADVTVVDTREEGMLCGQAITYPGAFIRVTGDDIPTEATVTVTDGWDETGTVETGDGVVDPETLPGGIRPDDEPQTVPTALTCDDEEFKRLSGTPDEDVTWGNRSEDGTTTFAMRVQTPGSERDGLTVQRGEDVQITMTNIAETPQETGAEAKHSLQLWTEAGWEDVRGTTGDKPVLYYDIALVHPPGEGIEWTLTMTEDGVLVDNQNEETLAVCPDLQPGRYRFVFSGLLGDESLAVAFDYVG